MSEPKSDASDLSDPLGDALVARDALHLPYPYAHPVSERETIIAEVFCDVLQVQPVGLDDRFADLGGDSFMALQLMLVFETNHGWIFESGLLETHDTPRAIAAYLDAA